MIVDLVDLCFKVDQERHEKEGSKEPVCTAKERQGITSRACGEVVALGQHGKRNWARQKH